MKFRILIMVLIMLCSILQSGISQNLHTSSNRALKAYNDGRRAYEYLEMSAAETYFNEAIRADNRFFEAYLMLGELNTRLKKYKEAAKNYQMAASLDSLSYK